MDIMFADEDGIYFNDGHSGKNPEHWKRQSDGAFNANPYMYKIYPSEDNRGVIDVFQVYEGQGDIQFSFNIL